MLTISATRPDFITDSIAYHKPATQSGVWLDNVASRAVDGYTNQYLENGYWSRLLVDCRLIQ